MADQRPVWYVHPYAGGPGVGRYDRPFHLSKAWKAMGHDSVVITPAFHHLLDAPRQPGPVDVQGVRYDFIRTPAYSGNGFGRLRNMGAFTWQLMRSYRNLCERHGRPSMIIASSPHPYVFPAAHHLARRANAVSVFEVRDLWPLSLVELAGVSPTHPLVIGTGWIEAYAYRNADFVVSLLPSTQPYMQERGLPSSRWRYIPNGVGTAAQDVPNSHEIVRMARALKTAGRFVLVYTGAIGPPNNIEALVNAVNLLRNDDVNLAVLIVGRGESQREIEAMVCDLRLGEQIRFSPQVPKAAIQALLQVADAGFLSLKPKPLFRFGVSPNKLFDYMQAALPVLFAVDAGNDPVTETRCGISVSPADSQAIARAIKQISMLSLDQRKDMGMRGHAYVNANHTYDRLAADYLSLLLR